MLAPLLGLVLIPLAISKRTLSRCDSAQAGTSCSSSAAADSCCGVTPGGLIVFRQRYEAFEGDDGRWGIDGLDVLSCDLQPLHAPSSRDREYTHEQIGAFFARSEHSQEAWENEWAVSEVGEGVEEAWERVWRASGRQISTLERQCHDNYQEGIEVPEFFDAIHRLHQSIPTASFLAEQDISPSDEVTYRRDELSTALSQNGMRPFITCVNDTLASVSWPMHVVGQFQEANFVAADVDLSKAPRVRSFRNEDDECPIEGIRYPPSDARMPPQPSFKDSHHPAMRPLTNHLSTTAPSPTGTRSALEQLVFAPGNKQVVDKKLGFFKKKDSWKDEDKDDETRRGHRDEL